jgi:hypothetical protein
MVMLRWRLPPKMYVHKLDPPPPGLHPVTNKPSWRATLLAKKSLANPKAHCIHQTERVSRLGNDSDEIISSIEVKK